MGNRTVIEIGMESCTPDDDKITCDVILFIDSGEYGFKLQQFTADPAGSNVELVLSSFSLITE